MSMMSQLAEEMAAAQERQRKGAQEQFINQVLQAPDARNQSKRVMLGLDKKRKPQDVPAPLFEGKRLFDVAAPMTTKATEPAPPPTRWIAPEVRCYRATPEQLEADRQAREAAGFDPIAAMRKLRTNRNLDRLLFTSEGKCILSTVVTDDILFLLRHYATASLVGSKQLLRKSTKVRRVRP